ncbi:trypsin-like serine protease [Ornithinimicrobium faecis]|uniref:trypsin-like serine protease n=2 Tax=Ornithinimicrobium faecis TaxID=2934158 RepID=UPI003CE55544
MVGGVMTRRRRGFLAVAMLLVLGLVNPTAPSVSHEPGGAAPLSADSVAYATSAHVVTGIIGRQSLPDWLPSGRVSQKELEAFEAELVARASAPEGVDVTYDPDLSFGGLSVAALEDTVFAAYDLGLSVEEVLERGTYANDLGTLAATWESRPGYAGWGFDGSVPYVIWEGEIPRDVTSELATARYPMVQVYTSNFDLADMEAASAAVLDQLTSSVNGDRVVFVDIDPRGAKLSVTTSAPLSAAEPRAVTQTDPAFRIEYSVQGDIQYSPERESQVSDHTKAPPLPAPSAVPLAPIALRGGASFKCTSGFTIVNMSSGTKRLATAGHCATHGASRPYRNHPVDDNSSATLYSPITYWDNGYDWGHYATGINNALATYYYDYNAKRYVKGVGSPGHGQILSVFGWATRARKSAIVSVFSRSCSGGADDGKTHALTVMDRHKTQSGDSGGPWFTSTHAYGVHSGTCTETGGTNSFTRVGIFPSRGWRVLTQ